MIGLDYETWSDVNLPVNGLDNYVSSPNFKVLIASVDTGYGIGTYDFVFEKFWGNHSQNISFPELQEEFIRELKGNTIAAHNAGFERAVTRKFLGMGYDAAFVDSAVAARAMGAESKLIVASRQLTDSHKLEEGAELVMLFCVPNEDYPEGPTPALIEQHGHMEKWLKFIEYCEMDATGSRDIYLEFEAFCGKFAPNLERDERAFELDTYEMNQHGWHVDLDLVRKMKQRGWANSIIAQRAFVSDTGDQINFNSHQQLKKYCTDRGVTYKSLDKYHLPLVLEKVTARIQEEPDNNDLVEVKALLETKQEIGGSTLSKLPKILDLVSADHVLRDQYLHLGAGQTFRTTGKGVQMQNLGKLKMMKDEDGNEYVKDVDTVYDLATEWSNQDMAGQLRQVFTSRYSDGEIIVGDFSAVESRGLAYLAGEEWKLDAYREGLDVYKVLVTKYEGIEYEDVTPALRPRGKYSELSCGYQASGNAVKDFMFRLGFTVTTEEADKNVFDWRGANPAIVDFWYDLDRVLKNAVRRNHEQWLDIAYGMKISVKPFTLESVQAQHPGSLSLCIQIWTPEEDPIVTRVVHGCYFREKKDGGLSLCYYKPAERLNGDLWLPTYKHPKTGQDVYYSIYGGKLAGILTQSLCRELFFDSLHTLSEKLRGTPNAKIIGQFHDEICVDWWPSSDPLAWTKEEVITAMRISMSQCSLERFPLTADIKSAYRYIK